MTRAKPIYIPTPRTLNALQLLARLGKSPGWFKEHRTELEAEGFPPYDELLGGWDSKAVEAWFDKRSRLVTAAIDDAAWMETLHNG